MTNNLELSPKSADIIKMAKEMGLNIINVPLSKTNAEHLIGKDFK